MLCLKKTVYSYSYIQFSHYITSVQLGTPFVYYTFTHFVIKNSQLPEFIQTDIRKIGASFK